MISYTNEHLTVFESQIYKTTSSVIKTDDCIIVVDPALLPAEIDEIRAYVDSIKGELPIFLIITHSDWDHFVGASAFPEAKVIASKAFTLKNADELIEQVKAFDDDYYIEREYPIIYPQVDIVVEGDGQQLEIGNTLLTFYEALGHTDDGIFIVIDSVGAIIAGDYLSDVEFPFIYSSSLDYINTLEKVDKILKSHSVNVLVPGHGHVAKGEENILQRKQDSLTYIKELKKAVEAGLKHEHLINRYSFQRALKKCHWENVLLIENELENEGGSKYE